MQSLGSLGVLYFLEDLSSDQFTNMSWKNSAICNHNLKMLYT